uniref:Putative secreted protein n=1 Tax=Anopheles triannulatus TaxID=58253 RepID=A0A2M4B7K8_9DIPT
MAATFLLGLGLGLPTLGPRNPARNQLNTILFGCVLRRRGEIMISLHRQRQSSNGSRDDNRQRVSRDARDPHYPDRLA